MPRLSDAEELPFRSVSPEDDMNDIPASIPQTQIKEDEEAEEQLEQELVETARKMPAKKGKGSRKQKVEKVVKLEEPVNGAASDEEEDEYEVESIVDHTFKGKKCFYRVRWKGWSEDDDTWEPEEHLLPQSAKILGAYHDKIGGAPQPPKQVRKTTSKAVLKETPPTTAAVDDDDTENPPAAKRAKRAHKSSSNAIEIGSQEWKAEPLGAWQPTDKGSWEDLVHEVETVERGDDGILYAFIRFRNGKRTRVANNIYTSRCPRAMVRFYEGHLSV